MDTDNNGSGAEHAMGHNHEKGIEVGLLFLSLPHRPRPIALAVWNRRTQYNGERPTNGTQIPMDDGWRMQNQMHESQETNAMKMQESGVVRIQQ